MRKTTVYLPGDLDRALKAKARRTGTPAAELVRDAIRRSLDEDRGPWPGAIGAGASGRFRAADDEAVLEREWGERGRPRS
jgi:Arc/MetJ-type ribon-helix-helix transcriptional regulator